MTSYDFSSGTGTPLESRALAGYDIMGNQVFSTRVSGPSTCYIWSYQGQYLVAKIENANYTDVVSVLGGSYAIDQFRIRANPTDLEVNSFLLPLRTIANAQVTTYTYQPLIGMTSSTDPKGQTVYYEYDDFQRLMTMKDQDRKILNFTDYHYKQ